VAKSAVKQVSTIALTPAESTRQLTAGPRERGSYKCNKMCVPTERTGWASLDIILLQYNNGKQYEYLRTVTDTIKLPIM
jgi:hypothetical protein